MVKLRVTVKVDPYEVLERYRSDPVPARIITSTQLKSVNSRVTHSLM